jgi:hypothetical protein
MKCSHQKAADMATAIEIRCINKSTSLNPHDRILNVGGVNADRTRWKLSQTEAIHCIMQDTYLFYIKHDRKTVYVVIANQAGWKYLKTTADGEQPDDLLRLPECPG